MNPSDFQRAWRASTLGGERDRSPTTTFKISSVIGAAAGWVLGMYSGVFLLIPLIATAAVFFVAWKLFPKDRRIIVPSFSVQTGHLIWFGGVVFITGAVGLNMIDLLWLLGGLIWLAARPGRGPIWMLGVYQSLSLGLNVYALVNATAGTTAHKALLVNVIWRLLALFLMGVLYVRLRRQELDRLAVSLPSSN